MSLVAMALAPAPAAAGRSVNAGACSVTLATDATSVNAGEAVLLHGSLKCPEDAVAAAGMTMTLYQHEAGVPGFGAVASVATASDGSYAFAAPALSANSAFYVRYEAGPRGAQARSERVAVRVLPPVTLASSVPEGAQVLAGSDAHAARAGASPVTFSGTVGAGAGGANVVLQRLQPGGVWRPVATAVAADDGSYSFTRAFRIPGEVSMRVLARHPGQHVAASEAVSFVVVARQNPRLTIGSSAPRVAYGQRVTISGVLAGAHDAPVALLVRHGARFQEMDHTTTDAGGAYAFTQTPLANTGYLVASGRLRSAALLQAVSFALRATPSSASIAAGEAVTFAGSIAPAAAGLSVYLQRQDASGAGWHTVQTASTAADGSYSITYAPASGPSDVFRVRVSRDQRIQGVASQSLTIEVRQPGA